MCIRDRPKRENRRFLSWIGAEVAAACEKTEGF